MNQTTNYFKPEEHKNITFLAAKDSDVAQWKADFVKATTETRVMPDTHFWEKATPKARWMLNGGMDMALKDADIENKNLVMLLSSDAAYLRLDIGDTFIMSVADPLIAFMALLTQSAPQSAESLTVLVNREAVINSQFFGEPVEITIKPTGTRYIFSVSNKQGSIASFAML